MNLNCPSNDAAPREFVKRHEVAIYRYLRYLGAEPDLAEDLTQECLLVGVRSVDLETEAQERRWLRGVARNLFFKSRDRDRFGRHHRSIEEADAVWHHFEEGRDGEVYLSALRECLGKLQPRARTALELRYGERLPAVQIGRRLSLRVEGVRTLLRRTKDALRRCIEREVDR